MNRKRTVLCKLTEGGLFVPCPVCRSGHILRLLPNTQAAGLVLYCRRCKNESVVDIQPGNHDDRVTLRRSAVQGIPPGVAAPAVRPS